MVLLNIRVLFIKFQRRWFGKVGPSESYSPHASGRWVEVSNFAQTAVANGHRLSQNRAARRQEGANVER